MSTTVDPFAPDPTEKLHKVLARLGVGSRRKCEELIAAGQVTVDGATAIVGARIDATTAKVAVNGVPLGVRPDAVYYLLNKPRGVQSTAKDTHGRQTVIDLVPDEPRVFPVGRLDAETEGLIICTNDGDLAFGLTHPSHGVEKEYIAHVQGTLSAGSIRRLRDGIELDDGVTAPAVVSQVESGVVRITIHEGRNRQVRRMFDAVGHPVARLVRVRIGQLSDRTLKPGAFRELTGDEVRSLEAAVVGNPGRERARRRRNRKNR